MFHMNQNMKVVLAVERKRPKFDRLAMPPNCDSIEPTNIRRVRCLI